MGYGSALLREKTNAVNLQESVPGGDGPLHGTLKGQYVLCSFFLPCLLLSSTQMSGGAWRDNFSFVQLFNSSIKNVVCFGGTMQSSAATNVHVNFSR